MNSHLSTVFDSGGVENVCASCSCTDFSSSLFSSRYAVRSLACTCHSSLPRQRQQQQQQQQQQHIGQPWQENLWELLVIMLGAFLLSSHHVPLGTCILQGSTRIFGERLLCEVSSHFVFRLLFHIDASLFLAISLYDPLLKACEQKTWPPAGGDVKAVLGSDSPGFIASSAICHPLRGQPHVPMT